MAAAIHHEKKLKTAKKKALDDIAEKMHKAKESNGGKVPHGFTATYVDELLKCWPDMTRDTINYHYRSWLKKGTVVVSDTLASDNSGEGMELSNTDQSDSSTQNHSSLKKVGRPKGSTQQATKLGKDCFIAVKNEIARKYKKAKEDSRGCRLGDGLLQEIINDVSKKRNLPSSYVIKADSIQKRIKRGNVSAKSCGLTSPLVALETIVVTIVIQMARIRQCLTPSCGVVLVNSLISGNKLEEDLIKWKKENIRGTKNISGTVGSGYWAGFMKRRGHQICSKKGEKYELDRASWTTYANFADMYNHIYKEICDTGVARKRKEAAWID